MIKMLKMQKIPNLLLLIDKDVQLAYFTTLTPINVFTILQDVVDEYVGLWYLNRVRRINKNGCLKTSHVLAKYFQEYI
jgi:hypothetical protein